MINSRSLTQQSSTRLKSIHVAWQNETLMAEDEEPNILLSNCCEATATMDPSLLLSSPVHRCNISFMYKNTTNVSTAALILPVVPRRIPFNIILPVCRHHVSCYLPCDITTPKLNDDINVPNRNHSPEDTHNPNKKCH